MYEQFSIDSKLLKPSMSFLKTIEERNKGTNSFSIKGSMIENPVGDIDIVDKRNFKQSKGNTPSNSNLLRFGGGNNVNSYSKPNEDLGSKLNLSHIKISPNNSLATSLMNNPQFINKSSITSAASPNITIDTNKLSITSQQNPNYKKGMFSYPKTNSSPVVIQGSIGQSFGLHEKPSFSNILGRPAAEKEKSTINTFNASVSSINVGRDDAISQRSNSTSKFDLNKFKIASKTDNRSVENIIPNKAKLEPNTNRQTLQSAGQTPYVQTIDGNTSYQAHPNIQNTGSNNKFLNVTADNSVIQRKNNLSKYLISEQSNRENRSHSNNPSGHINHQQTMNNFNPSNFNQSRSPNQFSNNIDNANSYQQTEMNNNKTGQSAQTSPIKIQSANPPVQNSLLQSNIKSYNNSVQNTSHILADTSHLNFSARKDDPKTERVLILTNQNEIEARRMTLELVKIILKTNPSHENDALNAFKEINVDDILLETPNKVNTRFSQKMTSSEGKSSIFPKSIQKSEMKSMNGSLEIKNNNFEINNYYGNYTNGMPSSQNPEEDKKNTMMNASKFISKPYLNSFNFNENSEEKLKWLTNLVTPRVMTMKHLDKTIPFIFKLVPTDLCFIYGLEHYILEFEHLEDKKEKGSIDLLKINHCTYKGDTSFTIAMDMTGKDELDCYEIVAGDKATAMTYVTSINYISQLIKCKFYAKAQK